MGEGDPEFNTEGVGSDIRCHSGERLDVVCLRCSARCTRCGRATGRCSGDVDAAIGPAGAGALHFEFLNPALQSVDLGGGGSEFGAQGILLADFSLERVFCLRILAQVGGNLCLKRRDMGQCAFGLRRCSCSFALVASYSRVWPVTASRNSISATSRRPSSAGSAAVTPWRVRQATSAPPARAGDARNCQYDGQFV